MAKHSLRWYASTADIVRMGPYDSQAAASRAVMSAEHLDGCAARRWPYTAPCTCPPHPVPGAFVWPEEG